MSSVKEYWKRDRLTEPADFETTSSDCSFDDLNSSISKEYHDASCNVDFDDETDELIDEILPNVTKKLTKNFDELALSNGVKNFDSKTSRYVRWNVLMSLGIGLWAVLCIVDLLHSEKSVTRDWLYESIRGRKIVSKIEPSKKLETPVLWYTNLLFNLWKIMTIMTSGGTYVLLFLLVVVFCADPRLRNNAAARYSLKNNVDPKISITKTVKNSTIEDKSLVVAKKLPYGRLEETQISNIITIRLKLAPSIDLQRKIFSSIENYVRADLKKLKNSPKNDSLYPRETRAVTFFKPENNGNESTTACLMINRELVEVLSEKNCSTFKISSSIGKNDWPLMKKIETVIKDSALLCPTNGSSRSNLNFDASTFDLEICEYLRRSRQSSRNVFQEENSIERYNERSKNFMNSRPKLSRYGETTKNRMITESAAFKKFLSSFQRNSGVS